MRIDPLSLITGNKGYNKKFYFITGNEKTLMEMVCDNIIENFSKNSSIKINKIKELDSNYTSVELFHDRCLNIVSDVSGITKSDLESLSENNSDIYVFIKENSPKTNLKKKLFLERGDSYIIDCYEMTREQKGFVLKDFINKFGLSLDKSLYWVLIERLENKYGLFINELNKISKLKRKNIKLGDIEKLISLTGSGKEKIFFEILNENKKLIEIYNKKISNQDDVYDFYYVFKQFCNLILNNINQSDFEKNIPKYLFREKSFLINIFQRYDNRKKIALLKLLLKTEKSFRKEVGLTNMMGLRFLLNFRKITIS